MEVSNFFENQRAARRLSKKLKFAFYVNAILVSLFTGLLFSAGSLFSPAFFFFTSIPMLFFIVNAHLRKEEIKNQVPYFIKKFDCKNVDTFNRESLIGNQAVYLLNVVEEMSLAANFNTPFVMIIPNVQIINSLSMSNGKGSHYIFVTEGALYKLSREEKMALIAHELSHIVNGDTDLILNMNAILHGLNSIYNLSKHIKIKAENKIDEMVQKFHVRTLGGFGILSFFLLIFGFFGHLIAQILKRFIIFQRDYLADSTSIQFTRNNKAVRSLLLKATTDFLENNKKNYNLDEFKEFYFLTNDSISNGIFDSLVRSVPYIENRIQNMFPKFNFERWKSQSLEQYYRVLRNVEKKYQKLKKDHQKKSGYTGFWVPSYVHIIRNALHIDELKISYDDICSESTLNKLLLFLNGDDDISFDEFKSIVHFLQSKSNYLISQEKEELYSSFLKLAKSDEKYTLSEMLLVEIFNPKKNDCDIGEKAALENILSVIYKYFVTKDSKEKIQWHDFTKSYFKGLQFRQDVRPSKKIVVNSLESLKSMSLENKENFFKCLEFIFGEDNQLSNVEKSYIFLFSKYIQKSNYNS